MMDNRDSRITKAELSRAAMVYVRQSSPNQVRENTESTRIQLGLREKAIALGWTDPIVIDDDLGVSGSGFANRPGFQRMLASVAMKQVGIILCLDATRLSRNSRDWAHLFELCGHFGTLIADSDQIYDFSNPNDRLLLGIKGSISEMELCQIRQRLRGGLLAKAERGELVCKLPSGYVHDPDGKIIVDPDERVRAAVTTMFDQFDRCTSVRQLLIWYRDTKTLFPIAGRGMKARPVWKLPSDNSMYRLLVHPIYAGTYVYGQQVTQCEFVDGKLVKRTRRHRTPEDYRVCIPNHHQAYISSERLLANRAKIGENRARLNMDQNKGAIREGFALLPGLLRCGQCGGRLRVSYVKNREHGFYFCDGGSVQGTARCLSFGAKSIDRQVVQELFRVVEPLAIGAAIAAADGRDREHAQELKNGKLAVEAVRYEASRAEEQFDLCDPRNRLVANTLEERWNDKLTELKQAQERLEQLSRELTELTDDERHRLHELAGNFRGVWDHPQADPKLKKRIIRSAMHEILVKHDREHQRLELTIHWQGHAHTKIHVAKRPHLEAGKTDPDVTDLIRKLAENTSDAQIARILNIQKIKSARGLKWTQQRVQNFRETHRIRRGKRAPDDESISQNEAAKYLGVSRNVLRTLARRGVIATNQVTEFAPWRISKSDLDSDQVQWLVKELKRIGRLPKGGCPDSHPSLFD